MNKTELVAAMAKETNLSKKDVEDVISNLMSDFVDRYNSLLEKAGWEDKEVDNFQVVRENIIIKEDD